MTRLLVLISALLASSSGTAQELSLPAVSYAPIARLGSSPQAFVPSGWRAISIKRGDLDGDGRSDLAMLLRMDDKQNRLLLEGHPSSLFDTNPFRLVVALASPEGRYRLKIDDREFFSRPEQPWTGDEEFDSDTLSLKQGTLAVFREYLRSNDTYRFRWVGGTLRLIGYDEVGSDGHCFSKLSMNFRTHRVTYFVESLGEKGYSRSAVLKVRNIGLSTLAGIVADGYYPTRDIVGELPNCY